MQGFTADWTKPAELAAKRGVRLKLVGNAVTVNTAEWIGRRLRNPGEYDTTGDVELAAHASWPRAAWNIGGGRYAARVSAWPLEVASEPLASFLRYDVEDLSARATAGFLSRTEIAKLRFPSGFLAAVRDHLACMRGEAMRAII